MSIKIRKSGRKNSAAFAACQKHCLFVLTRWETLKNGSEFVKPFSSAYIGTVESGLADSRKIQLKCGPPAAFFIIPRGDKDPLLWLYGEEGLTLEVIGNIHDNPELLKGGEG